MHDDLGLLVTPTCGVKAVGWLHWCRSCLPTSPWKWLSWSPWTSEGAPLVLTDSLAMESNFYLSCVHLCRNCRKVYCIPGYSYLAWRCCRSFASYGSDFECVASSWCSITFGYGMISLWEPFCESSFCNTSLRNAAFELPSTTGCNGNKRAEVLLSVKEEAFYTNVSSVSLINCWTLLW